MPINAPTSKRAILLIILFVMPSLCWATPAHVTVWFIKEPKISLHQNSGIEWGQKLAENFQCVPMGEGCFHPQLGYLEKNAMDVSDPSKPEGDSKGEKERALVKTFNSNETDRIDCDKNYHFDMYCGREGKSVGGRDGEIEIWLDVSSSLRIIDPDQKGGRCYRQSLVERVSEKCGDKMLIKTYNTSIKEISDFSYACINHGLNDSERLIKWIEASKAKQLFIITDISEFNAGLSDFLQSIGAKLKGLDTKDLTASDLPELAGEIAGLCK